VKNMYSAQDIAKWFLCAVDRDSGDSITHLKLQKLLYYAQAWSLVLLDKPMFKEEIQAWTHGPVVPEVYEKYSMHGHNEIPKPEQCPIISKEYEDVLEEVMKTYGIYQAKYLEMLTHSEKPWIEARGGLPLEARCEQVISLKTMKQYYTLMQAEQ
jgi:uncharacterized phage-associated protein